MGVDGDVYFFFFFFFKQKTAYEIRPSLVGSEMCIKRQVLDMAVLVESDLGKLADGRGYTEVVVVEAGAEVRLERLVARGMAVDDARSRMAAQATDADRRAVADNVVVNDTYEAALAQRVDALLRLLVA